MPWVWNVVLPGVFGGDDFMTPSGLEWLDEIEKRAKAATLGPWFVAERPWDDRSTAVYGNRTLKIGPDNDPHGARLITDCMVTYEQEEGEPDEEAMDRANAAHIASMNPQTALRLIAAVRMLEEDMEDIAGPSDQPETWEETARFRKNIAEEALSRLRDMGVEGK